MTDRQEEETWYSQLRERWRPQQVRLLLIGESAPDDGGDPNKRRFFYSSRLTGQDALFRAVVHALYDVPYLDSHHTTKDPWLRRLRNDGVFLIDLVPYPVNGPDKTRLRARARREHAFECAERAAALQPLGVVVCHGPSFKALNTPLREAGVPLLHDEPLPFPLGNWRDSFVERFRLATQTMSS